MISPIPSLPAATGLCVGGFELKGDGVDSSRPDGDQSQCAFLVDGALPGFVGSKLGQRLKTKGCVGLRRCTADIDVVAATERNEGEDPVITLIQIEGIITDLYDWPTDGGNGMIGWASRIQTCYTPSCGRTAGNIFRIKVRLDRDVPVYTPKKYDGYDYLWNAWYGYEVVGN